MHIYLYRNTHSFGNTDMKPVDQKTSQKIPNYAGSQNWHGESEVTVGNCKQGQIPKLQEHKVSLNLKCQITVNIFYFFSIFSFRLENSNLTVSLDRENYYIQSRCDFYLYNKHIKQFEPFIENIKEIVKITNKLIFYIYQDRVTCGKNQNQ